MFKRIDLEDLVEDITGFSYRAKDGFYDSVELRYESQRIAEDEGEDYVVITDVFHRQASIYKEDIPKLISALQAAYDFKGN